MGAVGQYFETIDSITRFQNDNRRNRKNSNLPLEKS